MKQRFWFIIWGIIVGISTSCWAQNFLPHQILIQTRQAIFGVSENELRVESLTPGAMPTRLRRFRPRLIRRLFEPSQKRIRTRSKFKVPTRFTYHVVLPNEESVTQAIAELQKDPEIEWVQPNYLYRPLAPVRGLESPNDPGTPNQYSIGLTHLQSAWDITTGNADLIIAFVDTGTEITHPDLVNKIWTNPGETPSNNRDDERNGYIDDIHGWNVEENTASLTDSFFSEGVVQNHGTHVAGIAGAQGNNGIGIAGVARGCTLLPIKAVNEIAGGFSTSTIRTAINYAVDKGAGVINLSIGGDSGSNDQVMHNAIIDAVAADIVVVAAAGNDSQDIGQVGFVPAEFSEVIAVSACNSAGEFDNRYSNFGSSIWIMAPGTDILSTIPLSLVSPTSGRIIATSGYGNKSGTSMATPFVSGVIALMRSYNPGATASQIRQALALSAQDKGTPGRDSRTGFGLIDAYQALLYIDPVSPSISIQSWITEDSRATLNFSVTDNINITPSISVFYQERTARSALTGWVTASITTVSHGHYQVVFTPSLDRATQIWTYIQAQDKVNTTFLPSGGQSAPTTLLFKDISPPTLRTSFIAGQVMPPKTPWTFLVTDNVDVSTDSIRVTLRSSNGIQSLTLGTAACTYIDSILSLNPRSISLPQSGTFNISIQADDVSGNRASTSIDFVIYTDTTGPTFSFDVQSGDYISTQTTWNLTVTDDVEVATQSIQITLQTPSFGSSTYTFGSPTWTFYPSGTLVFNPRTLSIPPNEPITLIVVADDINHFSSQEIRVLKQSDTLQLFGPEGVNGPILTNPNPFNPLTGSTKLSFQLSKDATVEITLYSLNLERIKSWQGLLSAGYHEWPWDGRDEGGSGVPNGMYVALIKATSGGVSLTKRVKIAVLRVQGS